MKILFLLSFLSLPLFARPLILISYYDPFQGAPFNNSHRIAELVNAELNQAGAIQVKLCPLNTIFDRAYGQLENCLKNSEQFPSLILGLGETGCKLKVETAMQNKDLSRGVDNAGERRNGQVIVANAPQHISLRYPLPQMYCSLTSKERKSLVVSKSAGTFVCNNTAYLMSYYHPEAQFGFIHVPSHKCSGLAQTNPKHASQLARMITEAVVFLNAPYSGTLPHSSNQLRLPIRKHELLTLRKKFRKENKCLYEYVTRSKPIN